MADPYGNVIVLTDTWVTRGDVTQSQFAWIYLHQGGRYEAVSALYHFRHRDFSVTLGRWLQVDLIGYEAGDANLYRYITNNPAGSVDPSGLEPNKKGAVSLPKFLEIVKQVEKDHEGKDRDQILDELEVHLSSQED